MSKLNHLEIKAATAHTAFEAKGLEIVFNENLTGSFGVLRFTSIYPFLDLENEYLKSAPTSLETEKKEQELFVA